MKRIVSSVRARLTGRGVGSEVRRLHLRFGRLKAGQDRINARLDEINARLDDLVVRMDAATERIASDTESSHALVAALHTLVDEALEASGRTGRPRHEDGSAPAER